MAKRKKTTKRKSNRKKGLAAGAGAIMQNPIVGAAIGAIAANFALKALDKITLIDTPVKKGLALGVIAYVVNAKLKQPSIAGGIAAIALTQIGKTTLGFQDNDTLMPATFVPILNDSYTLSDPYSLSEAIYPEWTETY